MSSFLQTAGDATGAAVHLPTSVRFAAVVLVAMNAFIIAVHTLLLAGAARRAPSIRRPAVVALAGAAFLALWFGIAAVVADVAAFPLGGGATERLVVSGLVSAVPMAIALALLAGSRVVRAVNTAMPSEWLVWAQSYRSLGFLFLVPYLHYGIVAAGFAWPAAVGDMITGLLAPAVGLALARRRPNAARRAMLWNAFGILDLVVAPVAAVLSGTQILTSYPLATIALFLGPPLGIAIHVYSLRNLALRREEAVDAVPARPVLEASPV